MRKFSFIVLGIPIFAMGMMAGCASSQKQAAAASQPSATGENARTIEAVNAHDAATVRIINHSAEPLVRVTLHRTKDGAATENLLTDGALAVGQSADIVGIGAGTWDIELEDANGQTRV